IIGILTSIAVPQYLKTVETGKADDAVATVNMIATTNKMFYLDHSATYVIGQFPAGAGASCGTNGGVCPAVGPYTACYLVWCKYLADQDWGDKSYTYNACNAAGGGGGACAGTDIAVAARGAGASAPYNGWGYSVASSGQILATGAAPPPTF
ncbi:MAG TPA: hypothetical protein VH309_12400, partial [Elusimicrobiota bacterium]|nr:hypothetical protein [Elusimicrobiota bacterium]